MPAWGGEGGEGGEPAIRGPVLGSPAPPLQGCLHVSPGPPPVGTLISGRKAEHVYTLHTRCPSGDEAGVHGCVWRCMCNRKPSSSAHSRQASTASPSSSPSSPETAGMEMLQLDSASMDIVGQCFHVHCSMSLGHLGEAV